MGAKKKMFECTYNNFFLVFVSDGDVLLFCIAPVRMVVLGFGASHKTDICKMSKAKGDKSLPSFTTKESLISKE